MGEATATFIETLLGYVSSFATSIISVWTKVIEFITSGTNAICLIPLIAWLFVLGVSSVRKMYKG